MSLQMTNEQITVSSTDYKQNTVDNMTSKQDSQHATGQATNGETKRNTSSQTQHVSNQRANIAFKLSFSIPLAGTVPTN